MQAAGPEARKTQRCSEDWSGEIEVKKEKTEASAALGIYTGSISDCCPLIASRRNTRLQLRFSGGHPWGAQACIPPV